MYDREPRKMNLASCQTTNEVGPGTYSLANTDIKPTSESYAPFLSLTGRDSYFGPDDRIIGAPAPGQYDPHFLGNRVIGGSTLRNIGNRFNHKKLETPGPGTYSVKTDLIPKTAPAVMKAQKVGRVNYQRQHGAPSIPAPGQAYGYEETEDGALVRQEPSTKDSTIGPAYYNPKWSDSKPTAEYRGVHWSSMQSKRMEFKGASDVPGPGQYDPFVEQQTFADNTAYREFEKIRNESNIPRYHEAIERNEKRRGVPGPGAYEVQSQFDGKPPVFDLQDLVIEHPPFGTQTKRFTSAPILGPSPGSYNDPRSALDALRRIRGMKKSPFGQTALRFPRQNYTKNPGPAAYSFTGLGAESLKKAYLQSTQRGVFGTTSARIRPILTKQNAGIPGPGQYQPTEKPFKTVYQQNLSSFASRSIRLKPTVTEKEKEDVPPPGSYEVDEAFRKSQMKRDPGPARNQKGAKRRGMFISAASRDAFVNDMTKPDNDIPGPGAYLSNDSAWAECGPTGKTFPSSDRFKTGMQTDVVPGPGSYDLSPLQQDTVLRGTFNVTLNNPYQVAVGKHDRVR